MSWFVAAMAGMNLVRATTANRCERRVSDNANEEGFKEEVVEGRSRRGEALVAKETSRALR